MNPTLNSRRARKTKFSLKSKILVLSLLPMLILAIALSLVSYEKTQSIVKEHAETNLKALATSLKETYSEINDDKYVNKGTEKKPVIYKGDFKVSEHTEIVDTLLDESDMVSTFFWNNTRIMTSIKGEDGKRSIGTTLDNDLILKTVLEDGKGHFESDFKIAGKSYYVYYLPLYQTGSDSEIIGMIFVGFLSENVTAGLISMITLLVIFVLVSLVIAFIFIYFATDKITKAIGRCVDSLNHLADGDLTIQTDARDLHRTDEIGILVHSTDDLKNNLHKIVGNIKQNSSMLMESSNSLAQVAKETERTVEQVEKAVGDIAEGATSQAQETQKASEDVIVMGDLITQTAEEVQVLNDNANMMKHSSDEASVTFEELKSINMRSIEAIDIIYEQTNTTNESALKIQEATHLITSIAEETNLLSLNASIEAARAGEQGRGFAVVAAQIQKLAEQSNESALRIEEIITSLINDSEKAVNTMQEVKQIMEVQSKNVEKTEKLFDTVKNGISESFIKVESISGKTGNLDTSRISIVDIVQNLTAVAQENAASTQETSAASAEVYATVSNVSDAAANLKNIANDLEENISIFTV